MSEPKQVTLADFVERLNNDTGGIMYAAEIRTEYRYGLQPRTIRTLFEQNSKKAGHDENIAELDVLTESGMTIVYRDILRRVSLHQGATWRQVGPVKTLCAEWEIPCD